VPEPWAEVRVQVRERLLDTGTLVRAVAAGRRRGAPLRWRRVEIRPVSLKAGVRLQVTTYDERQAHTANHDDAEAHRVVDELLDQGFGNWHVETATEVVQVRITKKGDAQVHREVRGEPVVVVAASHDRVKHRLFDVEHPDVRAFLTAVGVADSLGRIKPSKQDKYRQVEEFVRLLDAAVDDARAARVLRDPSPENPWRLVDLGCGHAYLTVGAYVWLAKVRGLAVRVHGVDVREDSRAHNRALATALGWDDELTFEAATIIAAAGLAVAAATIADADVPAADATTAVADVPAAPDATTAVAEVPAVPDATTAVADVPAVPDATVARETVEPGPDIVVALHACDTATDDALARAVRWRSAVVLAAPCCHHDLQAQVSRQDTPAPYALVTRHGLLRERFVDVLTDALRASILRIVGYRVEAVEFVSDEHTARNLLLRAVRTGAPPSPSDVEDYARLVAEWGIRPALAATLAPELAAATPHP
jgi:Methyltransferase domain